MLNILLLITFLYESIQVSDVYYTKKISSSGIVKLFKKLNITLEGKIGLKVHTGEKGGRFFLTPDFSKKYMIIPMEPL